MKKQFSKFAFSIIFAALVMLCGAVTATQAQDNDSYPKPDFTEIEKWYEVVKFEYDILNTSVYMTVKPKKESRPTHWQLDYRDADGVSLFKQGFFFKGDVKVGEPYRAQAFTMTETQMEKVKSVTLTRVKS